MTSVLFPLALLIVLSIGHYVHKREDVSIVFRRMVGAVPCVGFPAYFMLERPDILPGWMMVTITAGILVVYNFLFSTTLRHLSGKVEERKVSAAVAKEAERLAARIVSERDSAEFSRQVRERLEREVAQQFQMRLDRAISDGAQLKVETELREMLQGNDLKYAIWIGLHQAEEVLGYSLRNNEVLAIPYWVDYMQEGRNVRVRRYSTCHATPKPMHEVSFMSKRWSKVDGQRAIVADGALVTGVA